MPGLWPGDVGGPSAFIVVAAAAPDKNLTMSDRRR